MDIVFDLYLDQSIKQQEQSRRAEVQIIETTISNIKQSLPIEIEKFWRSSSNKMQLEQVFITWLLTEYKGSKPLFLGDDMTSCYKLMDGNISVQPLLKCFHEEADDWMIFTANHAVKVENYSKIIIASPDTDVFINSIHHFNCWKYADLEVLWVVSGNRGSQQAFPVHKLINKMDGN